MSSFLDIRKSLEAVYGALGDAQKDTLKMLFCEDDDLRKEPLNKIWTAINAILANPNYKRPKNTLSEPDMNQLFPVGDEFPDIFEDEPDNIDMNDFL
jgi:hypothetical protein